MIRRNERGRLVFESLDFECMIDDMLSAAGIDNMSDLKWVIERMHGCLETTAYDYCESAELGEWEDAYIPSY